MRTRHRFLYVGWLGALGCWLGVAWGCSPEYELLSGGQPALAAGNSSSNEAGGAAAGDVLNGGAGNAPSTVSGSGGVEAVAEGGESAVGGEDMGGSAAAP